MKDAVATMGMILPDDVGGRDAVHVAVIAIKAPGNLMPGDHVDKHGGTDDDLVGIVDPFLKDGVEKGQRFWLYLYPRTITSLHHSWTHPAFEDDIASPDEDIPQSLAEQKAKSEAWLRNFIANSDCPSYETLMAGLRGEVPDELYGPIYVEAGDEYLSINGQDASGTIPPEFWDHAEVILGKKFPSRPTYFSCSC